MSLPSEKLLSPEKEELDRKMASLAELEVQLGARGAALVWRSFCFRVPRWLGGPALHAQREVTDGRAAT